MMPIFDSVWGQAFGQDAAGKVSFYWTNAGSSSYAGQVHRLDPHPTATTSSDQPVDATYTLLATPGASGTSAATAAGPQGMGLRPRPTLSTWWTTRPTRSS